MVEDETAYGPYLPSKQGFACYVRTSWPERTSGGLALARGRNRCLDGAGVTYTELYETLYVQRGPNTWDLKKQNNGWSYFGRDVNVVTSVNCRNNNFNWWGARAFAASQVNGTLYTGSNPGGNGLKEVGIACGGT